MTSKLATNDSTTWIARTLIFAMFGLLPIHFFVPDEASIIVATVAGGLLIVVGSLSFITHRYRPFIWSFVAMVLHGLCVH